MFQREPGPKPELLAPAGTPAKLELALHFGADAVYLGLRQFSLRSRAGNFDLERLRWAVGHAHQRNRRVYVALNIQPFDSDLEPLRRAVRDVGRIGPDAIIVADPAVLQLAQQEAPQLARHLSTQTSVTNAATARFWFQCGIQRVIVARELHLDQLHQLVQGAGGEIEAFVHGAVCVAYSGRCLLSLYWAGRDPRRGDCAGGCRWRFRMAIEDQRRPGQYNPVEQDERGSYLFDAKDLCALPVLDRLLATGVTALKIEGRTRSPLYLASTVDVYRHAIDRLAAGERERWQKELPQLMAELARPTNRGFSTHFLTGEQDAAAAYNPEGSYPVGERRYLGRVEARAGEGLLIRLQNPVQQGEVVEIRDRGLRCERASLDPLIRRGGQHLQRAVTGDQILLAGAFSAGAGALVRSASADTAREES